MNTPISVTYAKVNGILMLNLGEGKIMQVKMSNVTVHFDEESEEIESYLANGTLSIRRTDTHRTVGLEGTLDGMTVVDPNSTT